MTTKPEAQMKLLAGAENPDGTPMYPGLRKKVEQRHICADALCIVPNSQFVVVPNPDLNAIIEACHEQTPNWEITLGKNERPQDSHHSIMATIKPAWFGSGHANWAVTGYGPDNLSAAIDALYKATLAEKAVNWNGCAGMPISLDPDEEVRHAECCSGLGVILATKEA
jgi:hypothetical protein